MKLKSNVPEYLAEAAQRTPGGTAVVDEFGSYTYKQLQDDSAAYGAALAKYDVANRGVVIMVEKSYDTLAIMLGTLFASGYYVPVDPSVPPARLAHIVGALGNPLLVTTEETLCGLQLENACETVSLEALHSLRAGMQRRDAVEPMSLSIDPAYVLFTSGSTGVPKGVVVSHGAIISFIDEFVSEFKFENGDRFANQAPFDFDVSVKDIFGSLAVGATLVIVPRRLFMQPQALVEFLDEQRVTVMIWAVAALCMVSSFRAIAGNSLSTVRKVLFSGEVMPRAHLKSLLESLSNAEFVNLYGPTEITCNCLYCRVDRARVDTAELPLGKAFGHCEVMVVDEAGHRIVESGRKGELIVRGPSLALGYIGNREATEKAFVPNPLNSLYGERVYRTGDNAMLTNEGDLVFCGRKDNQVKYQGHRIELEEIDKVFEGFSDVDRCRCAFDSKKNRLCVFYEGSACEKELPKRALSKLPVFMRPASVAKVENMPLNKNGKVDRAMLLELHGEPTKRARAVR